jgi:hypothetical protein
MSAKSEQCVREKAREMKRTLGLDVGCRFRQGAEMVTLENGSWKDCGMAKGKIHHI